MAGERVGVERRAASAAAALAHEQPTTRAQLAGFIPSTTKNNSPDYRLLLVLCCRLCRCLSRTLGSGFVRLGRRWCSRHHRGPPRGLGLEYHCILCRWCVLCRPARPCSDHFRLAAICWLSVNNRVLFKFCTWPPKLYAKNRSLNLFKDQVMVVVD